MKFLIFVIILFVGCGFDQVNGQGQNTGTLTGPNDPVVPVINFLQQLQRLRELYAAVNPRAILNARTSDPLSLNLNINPGPFSDFGQPRNSPLQSSSLGNGLLDIVPGNIGNNDNNLSPTARTPTTPAPAINKDRPFRLPFARALSGLNLRRSSSPNSFNRRISSALSEIVEGVTSANFNRILRGSLQLTGTQDARAIGDRASFDIFQRFRPAASAATNN